jgi:alkylation response protein AidB-like acyl-CoA dehydrogenase
MIADSLELGYEQRLLQETVAALLAAPGDRWAALAEHDVLGLPFAVEDGGAGGSGLDLMMVMQEIGRAVAPEPYLASVVLGGRAVQLGAAPGLRAETLAALAAGELTLALAYLEPGAGHDPAYVTTTAERVDGGYVLRGRKLAVLHGDGADRLVVSARTSAPEGIALFLVDADAGPVVDGYTVLDGRGAADVTLDGVCVDADRMLGAPGEGARILQHALDVGAACLAAEAVGAMDAALGLTAEHLRSRRQFGRPLSTFQALRHRVVDMHLAVEQCRSSALLACGALDDDVLRGPRASAAKALAGRYGRFAGQQAVQLHGGMGMSVEHRVSHCFTRLTTIEALLGDATWHLRRLSRPAR